MANDKKFIVKNGLLTQENVVIGSATDNGTDRLQVTGSSLFTGALNVTQSDAATPSLKATNSGTGSAIVAQFEGSSESLDITNFAAGDYVINNPGQNNGIRFYDNTSGIEIVYADSVDLEFSASGIDFKREPTYDGNVFWNAGNDGAGSGLDADLIDGLDSTQFVRSDQSDTMDGDYIITGNLTVNGTTTTINTEQVLIADNLITLNSNFTTGTPTENAGWEVLRGSANTSSLQWDETNDWFKLISDGNDIGRIITTADQPFFGGTFDADTVDGLQAEQFLRSDVDDTATGKITIEDRLTVGDGTGTAYIYMRGAGSTGYLAATQGEIGFLNSAFNFAIRVKTDGDIVVRDNIFADQFIDNADSTYLVQPSATSKLNNIDLVGALRRDGDTDTFINFPANDRIGFSLNSGQYGLMTATEFTYTGDMVANRFVDNGDNNYLLDPAGTSVLNGLGIDADLFHNGDDNTKLNFGTDTINLATGGSNQLVLTNTSATFLNDVTGPRFVDSGNAAKFLDPAGTSELNAANFYSGGATNDLNVGLNANERFNINVTDGELNLRYYQDETDSTNHSVNFEIQSSSTFPSKFTFNREIDAGSNTIGGGVGVFTNAVYAPKYWDSDDVTHYADFGNAGTSLYFAGQSQGGAGVLGTPTYSFKNDTNTGMYSAAADVLGFSAGGNNELNVRTTYVDAPGSFRSPLFYDLNDTNFYGDFAGTSQMNQIDINDYIRHRGDTTTYFGFPANDVITLVTNNVSRLNVDNDSADFSVNVYAPRYYDSNNNTYYGDFGGTSIMSRIDVDDYIRHRGDENTYFGFEANDTFRVFTNGTRRLNIDNDSADFAQTVYAPQFVTNDYLVHNGDTNTYIGFDANDSFGVFTGGVKRLGITDTAATFTVPVYINDYIYHNGDTNTYFGFDANDNYGVWTGGTQRLDIDENGNVGIGTNTQGAFLDVNKPTAVGNNPFSTDNILFRLGDAGTADLSIRTDSFGNIYYVNDNSGDQIWYDSGASGKFAILNDGNVIAGGDSFINQTSDATTNFITTPGANRFHSSGSIAIEGKNSLLSIYSADAANTAINEATFLGVNELGFSAGGGFYMDETTRVKVRGNKDLFTTGNYYGGRYYDGNNENYYLDPASTSILNRVDIDDYIRHSGDLDTYIGFDAADRFRIWTGGTNRVSIDNDSADFTVDVYAPNVYAARFYDSPDSNYYLDPAATSVLNRIDINDYIRHNGDTDNYFGFAANDTFRVFTGNTQRLNIDNNSADFAVNVYAPRYYDSNNVAYYADPAGTSVFQGLTLNNTGAETVLKFGPGVPGSDDAHIEWRGASNDGVLRFSTADDNGTEYMEFGDYDLVDRGGAFTQWSRMSRDYLSHTSDIRAPIFYDSNNTAFYVDPASTSNMNVVRASQYQVDGSSIFIDSASGDYGSIRVQGTRGGYAGYVINDDWGFISNGSGSAGIMNDTRNEWALRAEDNNRTILYANGVEQLSAENGFAKAFNSMRSPIYYPPSGTTKLLDLDAGNTSNALKIGGRILREDFTADSGANNWYLQAQDQNHFVWNTATNWGIFWATNTSAAHRWPQFGDNMLSFVGAGNTRMAFDLDSGDAYIQGELQAGNYLLTAGNEPLSLNPAYQSGIADTKMFDGTMYWEKRMVQPLQGLENPPTTTTSEYVKNSNNPGASSYVLRTSAYRTFDSDFIEVEPGEEIYGEVSVRTISGTGGLLYMGVRRYDKDKKPIATNDGITYFVVGGNNQTDTNWQTFRGNHVIPTSHTPFGGSDGGAVKYVRLILLMNYNAGGALREFTAPILKRSNVQSRVRTDQAMYSPIYYDANDTNYYLDPNSTSKLATVDANVFRDRNNTARYMDPATGGNVQGSWNWNNGSIENLNNLSFNDPGPQEGIRYKGGNEWKIFESPDNFANSGGNLQFTSGAGNGTQRAKIDVNGDVWAGRYMRAQRFYDSNNSSYYADPASRSVLADVIVQSTKASNIFEVRRTGSAPGNNVTALFANQYSNHSWGLVAEFRTDGNSGGDRPSINWSSALSPTSWSAGMFDGNNWGVRFNHGYRHGGWGTEVFRVDTGRNLTVSNGLYASNMYAQRFYDSDNTAYYGDFAGTSRMANVTMNFLSFDQGWDIYDDNAETLTIRSNNSDHGYISFRDSNSTECGRIEFDDDGFWGLKTPSNEWAVYMERDARVYTYYNGTWEERTNSGYMEARGSYRAPIFYDSNDTGFYANPNSTSRFRGLTVLEDITAPGITGSSGSLRRRDNRTISPSEDTSGELKFGFTSWANNDSAPYADYLHLRSYTDASGGDDNLVMFKKSGIGMRIWQQSWNSTTAYATVRNVAIYNENPDGSTNYLYADRFYDENTTSRYLEPAGTSQLNNVRINGGSEIQFATSAGNIRGYIRASETNDRHLQIATSGGEDIEFLDGSQRNFLIRGDGNTFTTGTHYAQRFTDSNNGNYYADPAGTSVFNSIDNRGEINNDGWFRNDTAGRGLYSTPYAQHFMAVSTTTWNLYSTGNTQAIRFSTAGDVSRGHVYADNGNNIGFLNQSGSWALRTNSGTTEIYGDLYANIMYDRNNTARYVDPNGTSQLQTVQINGESRMATQRSWVATNYGHGVYGLYSPTRYQHVWSMGTAYNLPANGSDTSGAAGNLYGLAWAYNPGYQGASNNIQAKSGLNHQLLLMQNGSTTFAAGSGMWTNGISTSTNSHRAPIFYDTDNTGYYLNAASRYDTNIDGMSARTKATIGLTGQTRSSTLDYSNRVVRTGDSNYWTGSMGWGTVDMNTVANWGSGFIDSWSNPANQPAGTSHWVGMQALHYSNGSARYGWQMVGGPIDNLRFRKSWSGFTAWRTIPVLGVNSENGAAMYASIYYDSNNTGYYCDPSSFSNFNTGVRATEFYARNWFRNDNAREGMYNQATGAHSYSYQAQYWAITGNNNSSTMSLQLRANNNGTMCRWMYGDRTWSGDLNAAGQWQLQTRHQDGYSPAIRFLESGNESWTGDVGNDAGKVEYHSNRMYIVAGANSNRICQFRRNNIDRSYVDNNGLYVGTATSARWADLAERYSADDIYENATVMGINLDGDSEITKWEPGMPLAGVISTNPAVQMNDMGIEPGSTSKKAKMNPFIALKGRIPCKVSEPVKKGQWVIPAGDGKAKGVDYGTPGINSYEIIGIALSDSENGEVEVKV